MRTSRPVVGSGEIALHEAVAQPDDPPCPAGDIILVGDHDDGIAAAVELVEDLEDLVARAGIEVAGRLVGEQDQWRVGEGAGDGDALALSARELVRLVAHAIGQPDPLDRLLGETAALAAGIPA